MTGMKQGKKDSFPLGVKLNVVVFFYFYKIHRKTNYHPPYGTIVSMYNIILMESLCKCRNLDFIARLKNDC